VDFKSELHTVLVQKMRSVMQSEELYSYLSESCKERLNEIRYLMRNSGILTHRVTMLSERKFAIFPWVGSRQLFTLHYALLGKGIKSKIPWDTCIYLEVYFGGSVEELEDLIDTILHSDLDLYALPLPDHIAVLNKYNEFIPAALLRKQFVEDFLDFDGLKKDAGVIRHPGGEKSNDRE
jgi:ATP-dependent helicase Lhr and Lhr-like helicase